MAETMALALKKISELESSVKALSAPPKEKEDGQIPLSNAHPGVVVDVQQLKQKLAAPTSLGKMKGVYDLVVPREHQARYSGRGRGKYTQVPTEIFEAMRDFFNKRLGADTSPLLVEAINQKAAQARHDLKEKAKSGGHDKYNEDHKTSASSA